MTILLSRGKPYPFPLPQQDSAVANFLRSGGQQQLAIWMQQQPEQLANTITLKTLGR